MVSDYYAEHPQTQVPDIKSDNKLTQEAHALLDDPGTWRQKLRDTKTFITSIQTAQDAGIDRDINGIADANEMLRFVNDPAQNTQARQAVEILRENPRLTATKSGDLDELKTMIDTGMMKGTNKRNFVEEQTAEIDQFNSTVFWTTQAALWVPIGVVSFAAPIMLIPGAAASAVLGFGIHMTNQENRRKIVNDATEAQNNRRILNNYDLFNENVHSVLWKDEYTESQIEK